MDVGAGPYKRRMEKRRYVQAACALEGRSVEYDYWYEECSQYGNYGTGKVIIVISYNLYVVNTINVFIGVYCGRKLASMIFKARNACPQGSDVSQYFYLSNYMSHIIEKVIKGFIYL